MPLIEPRVNRLGFVVNLARRRDARISVKEPTPARNEYQVTIATGSRERAASLAYLLMMHQAMSDHDLQALVNEFEAREK